MRILFRPMPTRNFLGYRTALSPFLWILLSLTLAGQTHPQNPFDPSTIQDGAVPPHDGPQLGEIIGAIAEKDVHDSADYEQLAQMTLQLGQSALQQGQRIPDESIWDGIHAVEEGRSLDPLKTDWETLRQELEKLLEKPPEDQQQDQDSEDQEQENEEQSENSEDQSESGNQDSDQDQSGEDSESNEEQKGENQDSQPNEEEGEQSQNSDQEGDPENPQSSEKLGDMDDPEDTPELDEKRKQPQEEQTQVGGTQSPPPPRSAKQAMTLQQLEQLKQQDKPGALHMLLQNAERDENAPPPQKLKKDW